MNDLKNAIRSELINQKKKKIKICITQNIEVML